GCCNGRWQHGPKWDSKRSFFSSGQKQRVAIAGILAMSPKYIILDEPTAMLDPSGRREVIDTLVKLNKEEGKTIILITHYMEEAAISDRVVVMEDGNMVLSGTPREVFSQVDKIKGLGLDVPQVTELAYELKKDGIDISREVLNIEEMVKEICH
ncbi:MAG: ATP-binding cassette domain-containing protein, partial [Peptoniphilus harei]|nr:ATP-binding cassette domain-containing protein [Peptoniphilus harei]